MHDICTNPRQLDGERGVEPWFHEVRSGTQVVVARHPRRPNHDVVGIGQTHAVPVAGHGDFVSAPRKRTGHSPDIDLRALCRGEREGSSLDDPKRSIHGALPHARAQSPDQRPTRGNHHRSPLQTTPPASDRVGAPIVPLTRGRPQVRQFLRVVFEVIEFLDRVPIRSLAAHVLPGPVTKRDPGSPIQVLRSNHGPCERLFRDHGGIRQRLEVPVGWRCDPPRQQVDCILFEEILRMPTGRLNRSRLHHERRREVHRPNRPRGVEPRQCALRQHQHERYVQSCVRQVTRARRPRRASDDGDHARSRSPRPASRSSDSDSAASMAEARCRRASRRTKPPTGCLSPDSRR